MILGELVTSVSLSIIFLEQGFHYKTINALLTPYTK